MFISLKPYLKSNMDRFIATACVSTQDGKEHLKSNMDRFIEQLYCGGIHIHFEFKIQYG